MRGAARQRLLLRHLDTRLGFKPRALDRMAGPCARSAPSQAWGHSNVLTAFTNAASAGLWRRPETVTSETVRLISGST